MRLVMTLQANKTSNQKDVYNKYYTVLHGFIFKKLEDTDKYKNLHDKKEFKPFCFGNLFPIKKGKIIQGNLYKLVISSPEPKLIEELFFRIPGNGIINLGEMQFKIESAHVKSVALNKNSTIENITPINITVKKEGKIKSLKMGDEGYLEKLKSNLIHKYRELSNDDSIGKNFDLFSDVKIDYYSKIREAAAFKIYFYNKGSNNSFDVIGSKLTFKFNNISDDQLRVFQYCFDTGFGERTSYGAGFMIERWRK